jgi:hypothetical protein
MTLGDPERDVHRRLLDLGGQDEIEPLRGEAMALIVEVTGGARRRSCEPDRQP